MKTLATAVLLLMSIKVSAFTLNSTDPNERGWAGGTLTFRLNTSNCPSNLGDIINAATGAWNAVPSSSLNIVVNGNSSDTVAQLKAGTATDTPVIVCDTNFGSDFGVDPNGVAGVGFIGTQTEPINYGALVINVQAGAQDNVSNLDPTLASIVLAHEIGHVLGLGHSEDPSALMYYDASSKDHLSLAQDDIDGITYLYPRSEIGGNGPFGCGLVNNPGAPTLMRGLPRGPAGANSGPGEALAAAFFLALPLVIALWFRREMGKAT